MKKVFISLLMMFMMEFSCSLAFAQTPIDTMDVPMGCFEEWETRPADSISMFSISLPIDYEFDIPRGWSIPTYDIDENVDYSGMNIPIQVSLPIAKLANDTVNMPQGHGALVVESFKMEDVLTPLAFSLASSFLDSSLVNTVLPSIAATGYIHFENILPLMDQMLDNTSNMSWLLRLIDSTDINNFISGGFPLNGFVPKQLMGYYKYIGHHEGGLVDNAAVVAFGTRYDTLLHRRMLVGAGSKKLFQLYDSVNYEPFYMDYYSLSEYYPAGYDMADADSMVVVVISSAADKFRGRGSRLFIDSLRLVSKSIECGHIINFHIPEVGINTVHLTWNNSAHPDRWEVEYGRAGFSQGYGTTVPLADSSVFITGLDYDTEYDFYVRGLCGDTAYTDWFFASCRTTSPNQHGISSVDDTQLKIYPNPSQGIVNVEADGQEIKRIRLYTIDGRMILEQNRNCTKSEVIIPNTGVYVIEVTTQSSTACRRIVNR